MAQERTAPSDTRIAEAAPRHDSRERASADPENRDVVLKKSAAAVHWNIRPFIGGDYRDSASAERFANINPANEKPLCEISVGDSKDIDAAVRVARRRFEDRCWSGLTPARRREILMTLADLIVKHSAEIALLDCLEMGKPIQAALFDATETAPQMLRSWAGFADKLVGESAPISPGTLLVNTYEPRGVIGAITPWNFPSVAAIYKVGPALAAGNTMVLKPSELASSSALKLAELAMEAGVPEGVLNVVTGLGPTVGEALALHEDVDMLSFTGSTTTGRKIMQLAGFSNGKRVLLECGGKSPQIVLPDIDDLTTVADATVQGFLWNQGQVCTAHSRLVVHADIKDALVDEVVSRAARYQPGDPLSEATSFGPLASPDQRDRVKAYVDQGLAAGAVAVLEGEIQQTGGCNVAPTVFDRVTTDMSIVREEIFGPVLCVQSFQTEEEAIALANGTRYGLSATVWTRDMGLGKRLAQAIKAGGVNIRTSGTEEPSSGCTLSFEPQKASGFGSELGRKGLESYSYLKWLNFVGT
jgi:acyl-CoA reductase-like NAD-dependent aldehyde dehydrogenase